MIAGRSIRTMSYLSCLAAAVVTKGVAVSSFVLQPTARRCLCVVPSSFSSRFAGLSSSSSSSSTSTSTSTSATSGVVTSTRFSRRPLTTLAASSAATTADADADTDTGVPITLLSGFLGSGKTTTLQHLLENRDGLRIGVIVNDMASVNIDAKLVKNSDSSNIKDSKNGVVELQNGCACCSLADELLTTVETLLDSRDNDDGFDAVVVELSGVADPIAIQQNWKTAKLMGHPVTKKADMKRVVTLIDSSTFGTDWMTWDVAGERDGWVDPNDDCAAGRKVPELLAEQIESADVLLLNKIDLAGPEQVKVAAALARTINDKAILEEVEFGKVSSPKQIIREDNNNKQGDTDTNTDTEEIKAKSCTDSDCDDDSHSHSHSHSHDDKSASSSKCMDSDCADPACSEHGDDAAVTDETSCSDPGCTDDTHDHSHSHDHSDETSCSDPDCTDDSHDHSHSHASTSTDNLGIVNFVYKADRPFEPRNLMSLVNTWPVPIKEDLAGLEHFSSDNNDNDGEDIGRDSPFFGVLRSKGFCWMAPTKWKASGSGGDQWRHDTAMYWSHAGKHFGISTAGKWWATLDDKKMKDFFKDDPVEYERIRNEDFVSKQWGDRRQEIVFIGAGIDQEKITQALDNCLLGEKGMERYSQELNNYMNTILTAPATGGGGLFDVGNYDNMDV